MLTNFVQWYLTGTGYRVTVYDGECQPLEEYEAGDNPLDSGSVARPGHKLSAETLIRYATQTAVEMAGKHGIGADRVSRDTDSETDAAEELPAGTENR